MKLWLICIGFVENGDEWNAFQYIVSGSWSTRLHVNSYTNQLDLRTIRLVLYEGRVGSCWLKERDWADIMHQIFVIWALGLTLYPI